MKRLFERPEEIAHWQIASHALLWARTCSAVSGVSRDDQVIGTKASQETSVAAVRVIVAHDIRSGASSKSESQPFLRRGVHFRHCRVPALPEMVLPEKPVEGGNDELGEAKPGFRIHFAQLISE